LQIRDLRDAVARSFVALLGRDPTQRLRRAALCSVALELGIALERYENCAHLVALSEDDLVELAVIERSEQAVEIAHRLADGSKLGV
jgi:hypothetical protein